MCIFFCKIINLATLSNIFILFFILFGTDGVRMIKTTKIIWWSYLVHYSKHIKTHIIKIWALKSTYFVYLFECALIKIINHIIRLIRSFNVYASMFMGCFIWYLLFRNISKISKTYPSKNLAKIGLK